jgi:hypothetical protein
VSARIFVLADTLPQAHAWCRRNGIRPYARTTIVATRGPVLRGHGVRAGDRVVFLGRGPTVEVLRDFEIAQCTTPVEDRPAVEYVR